MRRFKLAAPAVSALMLTVLLLWSGPARADDVSLAPGKAAKALETLHYICWTQKLCPLSADNYDTFKRAVAGQPDAQYLFGLNLINGDGVRSDHAAGIQWVVLAAEAGAPLAARYVENHLQNGENIEVDEIKVATALKAQADKGDVASMLALAPMMIRGRGIKQDPDGGMAMLLVAAEHSRDGNVEYQIAELLLVGTNGLPQDRGKAMEWYARAASRGNVRGMSMLGGLWENEPSLGQILFADKELWKACQKGDCTAQTVDLMERPRFKRNIVNSMCWTLRAALMGDSLSQYELALRLSRQGSDSYGNEIEPDLLEADYWFRLGARDQEHDNSQVRAMLEPNMTTAQLDAVKKRVAAFHQMSFDEIKAAAIHFPGKPDQNCPAMPTF